MAELPPLPANIVDQINAMHGGFDGHMGLRFVAVGYEELVAELEVGPHHRQPYGLVHGGVYATMVETLASVGAALNLRPFGRHAVGLDNATSFLRAVRGGILRGTARPLVRGRRTQVWEVGIEHDAELVASGRVRLLGIEQGGAVAGEVVTMAGTGLTDE